MPPRPPLLTTASHPHRRLSPIPLPSVAAPATYRFPRRLRRRCRDRYRHRHLCPCHRRPAVATTRHFVPKRKHATSPPPSRCPCHRCCSPALPQPPPASPAGAGATIDYNDRLPSPSPPPNTINTTPQYATVLMKGGRARPQHVSLGALRLSTHCPGARRREAGGGDAADEHCGQGTLSLSHLIHVHLSHLCILERSAIKQNSASAWRVTMMAPRQLRLELEQIEVDITSDHTHGDTSQSPLAFHIVIL
eukprot:scaffold7198_cov122-Isochrysis_galbana.AAC.3